MKIRDIHRMVEKEGLTVHSIERRNHYKVQVQNERGTLYTVIFPTSMGDNRRGWRNKTAQLRQIARGV